MQVDTSSPAKPGSRKDNEKARSVDKFSGFTTNPPGFALKLNCSQHTCCVQSSPRSLPGRDGAAADFLGEPARRLFMPQDASGSMSSQHRSACSGVLFLKYMTGFQTIPCFSTRRRLMDSIRCNSMRVTGYGRSHYFRSQDRFWQTFNTV